MAFRLFDEHEKMWQQAKRNYVLQLPEEFQKAAQSALVSIDARCGSPVSGFPIWHPLADFEWCRGIYKGRALFDTDHKQRFVNGILYAPYSDGQDILDSVANLPEHPYVTLSAQRLDAKLWHPATTSVLITCTWKIDAMFEDGHTFKIARVAPLFLEAIAPDLVRQRFRQADPWERFAEAALGSPCGKVSSLFLAKPEGQLLKKLWKAVCDTGMVRRDD